MNGKIISFFIILNICANVHPYTVVQSTVDALGSNLGTAEFIQMYYEIIHGMVSIACRFHMPQRKENHRLKSTMFVAQSH